MRSAHLLGGLVCLYVCVLGAYAQITYTILDVPNANTTLSGINNNGVIVGDYVGVNHFGSFTWNNGVFSYFQVPRVEYSAAIGINDSNVVVGFYTTATNKGGFIYDGVTFTDVQYPGVPYTELFAINNAGLAVGYEAPDTADYAGLTYDGTQFHTFTVPGLNSWSTFAYGVNNLGDIVGYVDTNGLSQAFLRSNGQYKKFLPPGSNGGSALGINDNGIIVGDYSQLSMPGGCFLLNEYTGKFVTFRITAQGSDGGTCTSINNAGVIVGFFLNSDTGVYRGFYTSPVTAAIFNSASNTLEVTPRSASK